MSHFRRIRDDEDAGADIDRSATKAAKREREEEERERRERERIGAEDRAERETEQEERRRTYRSPTSNYYYREKVAEDKGPLNMRGGDTLPAGHRREEPGLFPKERPHIPSRREKILEGVKTGAKKVGHGLKEAYEYEPSEQTKRTIKSSFYGARDEVASAGRQYTCGRRYRTRTRGDDYLGLGDLVGYADMFNPAAMQAPRRTRPSRANRTVIKTGNKIISIRERATSIEEKIGYNPNDPFGLKEWGGGYGGYDSFGSDYSGYADQFNPFKNYGRMRSGY